MNNIHNKCYRILTLNYNKGFLDDSVDATYIITLTENLKRHINIFKQINRYPPTKKIFIVYNKGYTNCDKFYNKKKIETSYEDISYCNLYIFNLAKNFNNILILEDDFIFDKNLIVDKKIHNDINSFILKNKPNIYYLGCFPIIINPKTIFKKHKSVYLNTLAHAAIYNKKTRDKIYSIQKNSMFLHPADDLFLNKKIIDKFYYYKPICNQFFPNTNNRNIWSENKNYTHKNSILRKYIIDIIIYFIKLFGYNKSKNIYNKMLYYYRFIISLHIIVISLILIFIIYKK